MALLQRVVSALERHCPMSLAARSWDNVGLLAEAPFPRDEATRVLLTIDLTPPVLEECLRDPSIGVVISYHPPIFRALKQLRLSDTKQEAILKLTARGISVYSPHTALDNCVGGINDWLASKLGKGTVEPIEREANPPPNQEGSGTGRILVLDRPKPLSELISAVKNGLNLAHVRIARSDLKIEESQQMITTIGICAGSGASVLEGVSADLYLSGEMGHHDVLAALAAKRSVILCEHTNTERGYLADVLLPYLTKSLAADGKRAADVVCSQEDRDPLVVR